MLKEKKLIGEYVMKKILPFVIPDVTCYPATSEACGILFADPAIHDWMYNNFIQLFEVDASHAIDYYDFAIENNPFLSYSEVDYTFIMKKWDSILSFIMDALDDNYYLRFFVNTAKMELYDFGYFHHDLIIYGYDREEGILYIADHFKRGKFSTDKCSFDDFSFALDTYNLEEFGKLSAFLRSVQMVKIETDFLRLRYSMYTPQEMDALLTFNIERIKESLQDYLLCQPTRGWFTRGMLMDEKHSAGHRWGLECYDVLCDLLRNVFDKKKNNLVTRQSFFVEYNHKCMMSSRVRLLEEKGFLKEGNRWGECFDALSKKLYRIMLLYFRSSAKRDYKSEEEDQILSQLSDVRSQDRQLTEELLQAL